GDIAADADTIPPVWGLILSRTQTSTSSAAKGHSTRADTHAFTRPGEFMVSDTRPQPDSAYLITDARVERHAHQHAAGQLTTGTRRPGSASVAPPRPQPPALVGPYQTGPAVQACAATGGPPRCRPPCTPHARDQPHDRPGRAVPARRGDARRVAVGREQA